MLKSGVGGSPFAERNSHPHTTHRFNRRTKEISMNMPSMTADASLNSIGSQYRCLRRTGQHRSTWFGNSPITGITPSDIPRFGTYQGTCVNCEYFQGYDGYILRCDCLDFNGQYRPALLRKADSCIGEDIANCNGQLICGSC